MMNGGRASSLLSPIISVELFVLRRVALCNSRRILPTAHPLALELRPTGGEQSGGLPRGQLEFGAEHEMNIRRVNKRFLADLSRTFSMAPALLGDREAALAAEAEDEPDPSRTADNDAG